TAVKVKYSNRVQFVQADAYLLETVRKLPVQEFDIIIDDGPHRPFSNFLAIDLYLPLLRPGGLFVLEDLANHPHAKDCMKKIPQGFDAEIIDLTRRYGRFDDRVILARRATP